MYRCETCGGVFKTTPIGIVINDYYGFGKDKNYYACSDECYKPLSKKVYNEWISSSWTAEEEQEWLNNIKSVIAHGAD